jgi:large subunit ribosomal protein L24
MTHRHIKKGDEVLVLSGSGKGKRGKVIAVQTGKHRAVVEGVCMVKKHIKKSQQHPNGAVVEQEGTVHISNLRKVGAVETSAA